MKRPVLFLATIIVFISACHQTPKPEKIILKKWFFKKGDNLDWASTYMDDEEWDTIFAGNYWDAYGCENYNGYGWYRIRFMLPESLLENSYLKDSIQLYLAKIDENDETYLNGKIIGKNGRIVNENDTIPFEKEVSHTWLRNYILPANSKLLRWGEMNTLAVRVKDGKGLGGIYFETPYISMRNVVDYLKIDWISNAVTQNTTSTKNSYAVLKNQSLLYQFYGTVQIEIINSETGKTESSDKYPFDLKPGTKKELEFKLPMLTDKKYTLTISYTEKKSKVSHSYSTSLPN